MLNESEKEHVERVDMKKCLLLTGKEVLWEMKRLGEIRGRNTWGESEEFQRSGGEKGRGRWNG